MLKTIAICLIFISPLGNVYAQQKQLAFHKKMKWLLGTWTLQNNSDVFEVWQRTDKHVFEGVGYQNKNERKEITEKMSLAVKNNKVYFIADVPHNKKEVFFEVIVWTKNEFTAENLQHDFPKRITYKKKKKNVVVILSAEGRQQIFTFVKNNF
ncbi:MAG: DUF6265 family protein [Cyclobacteriaceae bacterium]|jgi:hypothetical protein|nr:DUF6265 family protein [Flammeovirgaceae bacterium]MCZ8020806.1 DUF6265 family protein [Cytophagales bacterium]MCZ8328422.1 DUF6265 family protein [Cyclobacteriaceae bacterium]